jgi:hypothetical protein
MIITLRYQDLTEFFSAQDISNGYILTSKIDKFADIQNGFTLVLENTKLVNIFESCEVKVSKLNNKKERQLLFTCRNGRTICRQEYRRYKLKYIQEAWQEEK